MDCESLTHVQVTETLQARKEAVAGIDVGHSG